MGDSFLDSVQGLKELKIFGAGAGIAVVIAGLADHNLSAAEGLFLVLTAAESWIF